MYKAPIDSQRDKSTRLGIAHCSNTHPLFSVIQSACQGEMETFDFIIEDPKLEKLNSFLRLHRCY